MKTFPWWIILNDDNPGSSSINTPTGIGTYTLCSDSQLSSLFGVISLCADGKEQFSHSGSLQPLVVKEGSLLVLPQTLCSQIRESGLSAARAHLMLQRVPKCHPLCLYLVSDMLLTHPQPQHGCLFAQCPYEGNSLSVAGLHPATAPLWGPVWRPGSPVDPLLHALKFLSTTAPSIALENRQLSSSRVPYYTGFSQLPDILQGQGSLVASFIWLSTPDPPRLQAFPWHMLSPDGIKSFPSWTTSGSAEWSLSK